MNQDSFRQLLTTQCSSSSSCVTPSRQSTKKAVVDPSQQAFRPRKVKKKANQSDYRDRASERRAGVNDYAEVESVLEDFERRMANIEDRAAVEEHRRYLGGDKDHTILVKGLDFALLEQNKARAAESHQVDDSLEAAFQEAQPIPMVSRRRTREDIVRDLKEKRTSGGTDVPVQHVGGDDTLGKAMMVGKFKPIGTTDEPQDKDKRKKSNGKEKAKTTGESERKKRRKVIHDSVATIGSGEPDRSQGSMLPPQMSVSNAPKRLTTQPGGFDVLEGPAVRHDSLMELDTTVDIFADVGDYEGVDLGDNDDEQENTVAPTVVKSEASGLSGSDGRDSMNGWFKEDAAKSLPLPDSFTTRSPPPPPANPTPADEEPEPEQITRLAPLASSALPSISDFLAMDARAESQMKRKAKKEKKRGEKKEKVSTEVKVDRDYKKLNSYMAKKGSVSEGT